MTTNDGERNVGEEVMDDEPVLVLPLPEGLDVYEFIGERREQPFSSAFVNVRPLVTESVHPSPGDGYYKEGPTVPITSGTLYDVLVTPLTDEDKATSAVRRMCEKWAWLVGTWEPEDRADYSLYGQTRRELIRHLRNLGDPASAEFADELADLPEVDTW